MFEILTNRSIYEFSGIDALKFLQNLTTQDLKKNDYCYTYMLNNQGRYLFDFFVFKVNEEKFFIDIASSQAEIFQTKLRLYKLRSTWEIIDRSLDYKIIYSKEMPNFDSIYARKDPRTNLLGYRILTQNAAIKQDFDNNLSLYLEDKYELAIPDGYTDLIFERSFPLEYGAETLKSISYKKGCYIGQEFISRTKYQGVVRKKIFKITSINDLSHVSKGAEIMINNIKIGVGCSFYKNKGIALIREEEYFAQKGEAASIGSINIELIIPFWRQEN